MIWLAVLGGWSAVAVVAAPIIGKSIRLADLRS